MKKIVLIFLLFCISCSPLEMSRILGVGTKPFREKGKVYTKDFNINFFASWEQIRNDLDEMGSRFYRGNHKKGFIVAIGFDSIFKQCNSSTEVAVFLKELEFGKTQVEVASLNHLLANFVASKLFNETLQE